MTSKDSNWKSWVRMFDIPEISKHKSGFTLYKIISILYPESCPDAITKVTVWKRFNDIKILHKEINVLQKKLNIKSELPSLPKSVLFKRFDEETIKNRKTSILNLLEHIGSHSALFTSSIFVKFFETSHTPIELLNGNINAIRASLNLPDETDFSVNSDEDKISDTDSFTSINVGSVSQTLESTNDFTSKPTTNLKKLNSMTSIDTHSSQASESYSILNIDPNLLLESQFNSSSQDSIQYLVDASVHIHLAIELENEKKYEDAFTAYKTAVDILINGGKNESDYDRKRTVKYKTEKYLLRAEKIYNMYLAPEIKDMLSQSQAEADKPSIRKGPLFNLYKYKVIKIISPSGMLVIHSEHQQLYYIKVIHKTVQFLNEHLILPENVPYMVKLVNHYNCDYALFLVLEYCSGTKLIDLLKNESCSTTTSEDYLLKKIQDQSDNESELSFSELLNEYASSRQKADSPVSQKQDTDNSSFEKVEIGDVVSKNDCPNFIDEEIEKIKSVPLKPSSEEAGPVKRSSERKLSEISSIHSNEEIECKQHVPEAQIVKWASQLVIALEKLHSLGIICRDLNIENLLLDENKNLVLTYVCNVKELCDLYTKGINLDLAPEVYSFEEVTEAVDWWSFGAILYELLVGMPLSKVHVNGITSYTHLKIPKYISPEARSLLKQLLTYEPNERLGSGLNGTQHLKSHPFFKSVSWSGL